MATCRITPVVNGKPSTLFNEMKQKLGDRETTKSLYSVVTTNSFLHKYAEKIVFNEQNEPTFESLTRFLNLDFIENKGIGGSLFEEELNSKSHKDITSAVKEAVQFNSSHANFVAIPGTDETGKIWISVKRRDEDGSDYVSKLETAFSAYEKLSSFLEQKGISVKWLDANLLNGEDGLMMPENIGKAVNETFGVINLANNMQGFFAFSEETAHFIIENIKDNEIIRRCENLLENNEQMVREALGDDYDSVVEYYSSRGKNHLIAREALGRILADSLNNETRLKMNIFERAKQVFMDFIYRVFRINNNDIETLDDIKREMASITDGVIQDRNIISEETLAFAKEFGDTLAHAQQVSRTVEKLAKRAEESLFANIQKYLTIYKPKEEDEALLTQNLIDKQFKKLVENIKKKELLDGIYEFAEDCQKILQKNYSELIDIREMKTFYANQIRKKASTMCQIKNLIDTYREPIIAYKNLCTEIIQEGGERAEHAAQLKIQLGLVQQLINSTEETFAVATKNFLAFYLRKYFTNDQNAVEYIDKTGKKHIFDMMAVLEYSMSDISGVNRLFLSAAHTDDLWVGLVDNFLSTKLEEIRQKTLVYDHKIRSIDLKYRKASKSRDTSFICEFDENGIPTGYFKSEYDHGKYLQAKKAERERLKKLGYKDEALNEELEKWVVKNTDPKTIRKFLFKDKEGKDHYRTKTFLVPKLDLYRSTQLNALDKNQLEYYNEIMKIKEELDWFLPNPASNPYIVPQIRMANIGEAIVTSKQGITGTFMNALSTIKDDWFLTTELDNEEYQGKNLLQRLAEKLKLEKSNENSIITRFDNTPYERIPIYYVKMLEDMRKLSTDITSSMREYAVMAVHYGELHDSIDIINLIREQNANRRIEIEGASEVYDSPEGVAERHVTVPTKASNVYKRVEDLISMKFFSHNKNAGYAITESITTGKLADTLMRYTSFSLLGYNFFSAINNIVVGKYQMLIETMGGEYFTLKDWGRAEKEYYKLLFPMLKEIHLPYSKSKMALIMETFNVGLHWKQNIMSSKSYRNAIQNVGSKLDSNFMLDMGEHYIQMTTALAYLMHLKLYSKQPSFDEKGNLLNKDSIDVVSAYDALDIEYIKDNGGNVVDTRLKINSKYKNYIQADGKKFSLELNGENTNLADHSLLIGEINQMMHGIYNSEDMMVFKKYSVGRFVTMYRNHIIPQLQKRFKTLGKHRMSYNYRTHQKEEGYYVTFARCLMALLTPYKSSYLTNEQRDLKFMERWEILKNSLTKHQTANLKKFATEMSTLLVLFVLSMIAKARFDDDDDESPWISRQLYYQLRRLELEGSAYFPPTMLSSFMQILISPTAVIGPIEKIMNVVNNIPNSHKILKTGPYKGHSKLYAELMRALPVYPQLRSFFTLAENDGRFSIFKSNMFQQALLNALSDED